MRPTCVILIRLIDKVVIDLNGLDKEEYARADEIKFAATPASAKPTIAGGPDPKPPAPDPTPKDPYPPTPPPEPEEPDPDLVDPPLEPLPA
jgi:hypothetical protein